MPACVECGRHVDSLYTEYSGGRGNISLTQCACGRFADKYIEYDRVVVFVDMILHKPQVYRHLLFNTLGPRPPDASGRRGLHAMLRDPLRRGVLRLCVLLVLFEVYIKWAKIDAGGRADDAFAAPGAFAAQYAYLFSVCLLEFLLFQVLVSGGASLFLGVDRVWPRLEALVAGLIISSFGKLLHIVMVIWDYNDLEFSYLINLTVFTSNIEAVAAVLCVPYPLAAAVLALGLVGKGAMRAAIHHFDRAFPLDLF